MALSIGDAVYVRKVMPRRFLVVTEVEEGHVIMRDATPQETKAIKRKRNRFRGTVER